MTAQVELKTETGFTPGPWKADTESGNVTQDGHEVATAWFPRHRSNSHSEREANAYLIAAAPALYEALEQIMYCADGSEDWYKAADALFAARGEP